MSFFKDLKEDIVQSVNELGDTIEEHVVENEGEEDADVSLEQQVKEEMESVLQGLDSSVEETDLEEDSDIEEVDLDTESEEIDEEEPQDMNEAVSEEIVEDIVADEEEEIEVEENEMMEEEIVETLGSSEGEETVITQGTTINGGIQSDTSLVVKGTIVGDVDCKGKLTITGKVAGNSTAAEIYVNTARLEGDLTSEGRVKVGVGTVVIGTITSESLVVAGAVKGSIEVDGPVVLDSTAVVKGDIVAKSIQINTGAVIDGNCSMTYANVDLDSFFE